MRIIAIMLFVLMWPSAVLPAEKPLPPLDIDQILQDLRDMDSSTGGNGDHVVGEHLC